MCRCPSDWEYNKISHQKIKIQFATGQRGSLEVRKQEGIMKAGTPGAGRDGVSMGSSASHGTLNSSGIGKQRASKQEMPGSKQGAGRNFPGSHIGPLRVHHTDLSALVKAVTPTLLSLCSVTGRRRREVRREREGAQPPFQGQASSLGVFFSMQTT